MELGKLSEIIDLNFITFITKHLFIIFSVFGFVAILRGFVYRVKRPPGPFGLPFVGYIPFLGTEPHKTFWSLRAKYGHIISVYIGSKCLVVLNKYEIVKDVLSHPGSLDRAVGPSQHLHSLGFLTENGKRWVEQRRFTMLTITELLKGENDVWEAIIKEDLSVFIEKIHDIKGKPFELADELLKPINNSMFTLLIGRRLDENEMDKFHLVARLANDVVNDWSPLNNGAILNKLRRACGIFKTAKIQRQEDTKNIVCQFYSFLKEEIKKHTNSSFLNDNQDFISFQLKKISEMSTDSNKRKALSETILQGNLIALFVGASETIHATLEYLFHTLKTYKEIQEKVYFELKEVIGKNGHASYHEKEKTPYTFAVLMEAQRFLNIAPLTLPRRANQDIPINGYVIPKDSEITTNLWALHHDPDYWDYPEQFRPERFLMDGGTNINMHNLSFAPFGYGKRNCPGQKLAWTELFLYFTEIVKHFEITTPEGVEEKFEVSGKFLKKLIPRPMCFKERNI